MKKWKKILRLKQKIKNYCPCCDGEINNELIEEIFRSLKLGKNYEIELIIKEQNK